MKKEGENCTHPPPGIFYGYSLPHESSIVFGATALTTVKPVKAAYYVGNTQENRTQEDWGTFLAKGHVFFQNRIETTMS